jgi:transposase
MLPGEIFQEQLQKYNFDELARCESNGRRRMRLLALAHLKEGKSYSDVARALRVSRHGVMRWMHWFSSGGVERLAGVAHHWSTQRLPKSQEEAFRVAVEQLQVGRNGGRIRGEDIRQLLSEQFHIQYSLGGVYHVLERLKIVWISARSIHSQANPLAQAEFKKKL